MERVGEGRSLKSQKMFLSRFLLKSFFRDVKRKKKFFFEKSYSGALVNLELALKARLASDSQSWD